MKHILLLLAFLSQVMNATAQTPNTQRDPDFLYDPTGAGTLIYDFQEIDLTRIYALNDGKIMVVGSLRDVFYNISGMMRLNNDGSFDESFDSPDADENLVIRGRAFAELSNGKYLIGGLFNIGGTGSSITGLMCLNSDGTQDTDFGEENLAFPLAQAIAVQPDGKILIGGPFASLDFGASIARLNPDGSRDESFFSEPLEARDVRDIQLLPDGRILVTGNFSNWPTGDTPHSTTGAVLLNADGSVNTEFSHAASQAPSPISTAYPRAAIQPDGKIIVASLSPADNDILQVVRYNADFSLDADFYMATNSEESGSYFTDVTLLSDGKILLSGYFINSYDGDDSISGIFRLNPDGTIDQDFDTNNGFGNGSLVYDCAVQSDGKILLFNQNSTYQDEDLTPNEINPVRQVVIRLNGDGGPTSVAVEDEIDLEMYPNPAEDFVTLRGIPERAQVRIFDIQGRLVYGGGASGQTRIVDTSNFPAGLYIVEVSHSKLRAVRKLVIDN